jgi:hypothetical protein
MRGVRTGAMLRMIENGGFLSSSVTLSNKMGLPQCDTVH